MLALTDHQMKDVTRTAALLPVHHRDLFLRTVAGRLSAHPTDFQVLTACLAVLGFYGLASPEALAEQLRKECSHENQTSTSRRRRQRQRFSNGERPSGFERRRALSRSP